MEDLDDYLTETDAGESMESPDPAPAQSDPAPAEEPFRVRSWKGHDAFLCKHCAFSTLRREEMDAHLDKHT